IEVRDLNGREGLNGVLALLESSDGAAFDVLSGAADYGPTRATENVNEGRSVLAILPPCGSRYLDVIADNFELILGPRANLFHEKLVVADYVPFGIKRHRLLLSLFLPSVGMPGACHASSGTLPATRRSCRKA